MPANKDDMNHRVDDRTTSPRLIAKGIFEHRTKTMLLPDGRLMAFVTDPEDAQRRVYARFSTDGDTWSDLQLQFDLVAMPSASSVVEAVVDQAGEIQAFMLAQWCAESRGEAERGGVGTYGGYRIDVWHTRSTHGRTRWEAPKCIWEGYTGALNSSICLSGGRVLLPFSYYVPRTWRADRGTGLDAYTFTGMFNATVLFSDDEGATWQLSNDLKVITPDITYAYGACEPVVLELADGRVWMLIRAQMGRFYESFSTDGACWSKPRPTSIRSSDSPAGLVRLPVHGDPGNANGSIILLWNNCLRYPYAYGGRQVLHAAISEDEGQSWRGYREVAVDPHLADPPPISGDHGTAYPFPSVTSNGQVVIFTGQGEGRAQLVRLDPAYLYETTRQEDFSNGLQAWSVFGSRGVECVAHPDLQNRKILRLQRLDDEFPASAVWNFPAGAAGTLRIRCLLEAGASGLIIGLTDHFSTPFDFEDVFHNVCTLRIGDSASEKNVSLSAGRWHDLCLHWNEATQRCLVELNDQRVTEIPLHRQSSIVSYLRLRSLAENREPGGILVESVRVEVQVAKG